MRKRKLLIPEMPYQRCLSYTSHTYNTDPTYMPTRDNILGAGRKGGGGGGAILHIEAGGGGGGGGGNTTHLSRGGNTTH